MPSTNPTIIIDNGHAYIRVGLSNQDSPYFTRPAYAYKTGRRDQPTILPTLSEGQSYWGQAYPFNGASITDENLLGDLWGDCFSQLKIDPKGYNIIVTQRASAKPENAPIVDRILLNRFGAAQCALFPDALLSSYAAGYTPCIVLDIGAFESYAAPVVNDQVDINNLQILGIGGCDLIDYRLKILTERGYSFTTQSDRKLPEKIKETLCYVAQDFNQEMATAASSSQIERSFEKPDGDIITLGNERFRCPEALFQPAFLGKDDDLAIQKIIQKAILASGDTFKAGATVVLSGGGTQFPGLASRLQKETAALFPDGRQIKVIADPHSAYLPWLGAAAIAENNLPLRTLSPYYR